VPYNCVNQNMSSIGIFHKTEDCVVGHYLSCKVTLFQIDTVLFCDLVYNVSKSRLCKITW
jgi:hypothetical protein